MTEPVSPLQIIKQKELELRNRLEELQHQADTRLQTTRTEASQMIAQADREGQAEAEAAYKQGVMQAEQEAEAILAAAHQQAAVFHQLAAADLGGVAEQIVQLVLPPRGV